jgi:hypothetical protein
MGSRQVRGQIGEGRLGRHLGRGLHAAVEVRQRLGSSGIAGEILSDRGKIGCAIGLA